MNAEAIVSVSALVVALVQLAKWARMPEEYGPAAVLGLSLLGVAAQVFGSTDWPPDRLDTMPILTGWAAVATSAAGVFGFTRAAVGAVTRATPPPPGAGEQTVNLVPTAEEIARAYIQERRRESDERRQAPPPPPPDMDPYRPLGSR